MGIGDKPHKLFTGRDCNVAHIVPPLTEFKAEHGVPGWGFCTKTQVASNECRIQCR